MSAADKNVTVHLSTDDRLDIVNALYVLGAGIDENSAPLLESAFTSDALVDFGPAGRAMGIDFPALTGREAIVSTLTSTVGLLDTTHTVTNPRIQLEGDRVILKAIVEAQHLPPGDHSRKCLMKNRYTAEVRRDQGTWRVAWLEVQNAWFEGEPNVLLGH